MWAQSEEATEICRISPNYYLLLEIERSPFTHGSYHSEAGSCFNENWSVPFQIFIVNVIKSVYSYKITMFHIWENQSSKFGERIDVKLISRT